MAEQEHSQPPNQDPGEVPMARVWPPTAPVPVAPLSALPLAPPPPQPPAAYRAPYGGYAATPPFPSLPDYAAAGGYGTYSRPSKPSAITTIGVLSIVVASLSIVASGVSAVQCLVQQVVMQMSRTMSAISAAQAAQAAAQAAATQPATAVGPAGLGPDERAIAVSVMTARQGLNPARQAQLDDLLAKGGQNILHVGAGAVTSDAVRRNVVATSRGRSVNPGEAGPDYLTTVAGKIELYDGNGVFRPDDRGQPTIRATADVNHYLAVTGQAGPAAQGAATTTAGASAAAGGAAVTAAAASPVPVRISPGPMMGVLIQCLLSLLLAIFLLVSGILTLRGSRAGGKLHLIYALIKIPLVALGAYLWWQLESQFLGVLSTVAANTTGVRPPASPASVSVLSAHVTWIAILAAAYPIVLLVLLSSRTVRDYYRGA